VLPSLDAETRVCAVIGNPVRHSLSPAIHNAAFRHLGLNFAYLAFEVADLEAALSGARALGMVGLSITIPHKTSVIRYLDEIDPAARRTGSVNTVVNRRGRLFGTSSDGAGMLRALAEAGVETRGRRALILGAGGAARAVGFALALEGGVETLTVTDLNSRLAEAQKLADEIAASSRVRATPGSLEDENTLANLTRCCDLLLNCTPVGMHPNQDLSPLPASLLRKEMVVFDAVYTPRRTRLLSDAERAGAKVVEGLGMFVHQAAVQFELWTGKPAPVEVMREVAATALAERERNP